MISEQQIKIKSLDRLGLGIIEEQAQVWDEGSIKLSEINNDRRKDPNQSNKMWSYRKIKIVIYKKTTFIKSPIFDTGKF